MLHEAQRATPASSGEALTELYRLYAAEAYRFAVHLTGRKEDAEDVLQQVFLQAHRHLESGAELVNPRAWLMLAVKHRVFNLQRRRRETPEAELEPVVPYATPADEAAELSAVRGVLWTLPEKQHQAFVLRYWSGLSQSEIAQVLGTTASAVESLLVRARTTLINERSNGSEECERVRLRLIDGGRLSDHNHDHLRSCNRCRAGQLRLSRVADFASVVALAPSLHVAHSLAALVPGFSAPVAGLSVVSAPAAAGASTATGASTAVGGTTAVTAATASGKLAIAAKVVLAVAATTAAVSVVPPIHRDVDRALFPQHAAAAAAVPAAASNPGFTGAGPGLTKALGTVTAPASTGTPKGAGAGSAGNGGGNAASGGKAGGQGNGKAVGQGPGTTPTPGTGNGKGTGPGTGNANGSGNGTGNGNGKGTGQGTGNAKGAGNGKAKGAGNGNANGAGNGKAKGAASGNANGSASGNANGSGTGKAKGAANGKGASTGSATTSTSSNGNGNGAAQGNGKAQGKSANASS